MATNRWIWPALLGVTALTLLRLVSLAITPTDLFVDEAQYWFWGQDLAFGYYSKPPLIGWLIRAVTDLAGSDAAFWVRFPAPILHAITAMLLGQVAQRLWDRNAAIAVALAYVSLPMVGVGSFMISTDTVMFPFLALSLVLFLHLRDRPSTGVALGVGMAIGLGFMAKYAAVYYLAFGAVALIAHRSLRPTLAQAGLILLGFVIAISPNLIWNALNGFSTVEHTLDNADWVRQDSRNSGLNPDHLLNFFGAQFAVFGPILFGGLLVLGVQSLRGRANHPLLMWLSLPIVALVCVQALLSEAYANWAAAAYLAGIVAVVPWLMQRRFVLWLSMGINVAFCLFLLVTIIFADRLQIGGNVLLERYLGREVFSQSILDAALDHGAEAIVAENRDILADLFYTGRDVDITINAAPFEGRPMHHYAQKHPYQGVTGSVLVVQRAGIALLCDGEIVEHLAPTQGAYAGQVYDLTLVAGSCWSE